MTKAHETPFTPGQQATVTSRLAVALPGALELLAKSGIGIKSVLTHTKEGDRLMYALAMAIRALYNGHADTIPPSILTRAKAINIRDRDEALIIQALWQAPVPGFKASYTWNLSVVSPEDMQLKHGDQFVYLSDNGS